MQKQIMAPANGSAPETARARQRRFLILWLLVSAFWLSISIAAALEMSFMQSADLAQSLWFALGRAAPWIFLTPLIFWVSSRFTFEKNTWRRSLWVHAGVCVFSLGVAGYFAYLSPPLPILLAPTQRDPKMVAFRILQRVTLQVPSFWGLVGVSYALWFYERGKARALREAELESRLTAARLQALRMQLNPHFLFNTLNSIASLVHEDPQAADSMISALSDLLRLTLKTPDRQEVTLEEELRFLDRYLEIEQIRFGARLQVEKHIEAGALDAMVPVLILQPLVENAVKHGIEARLGPNVIRIVVEHVGSHLRLAVADNGRGRAAAQNGDVKEGVGLGNTRSRLRELYGADSTLNWRFIEDGGFFAEITLPWRTQSVQNQARAMELVS
jgi:two-component sensor histidine kinase